jgi:hypothetical protein
MPTDLARPANPARTPAALERRTLARAFWGAVAATLVLYAVPFGRMVLYPFSLLVTWAHEMGHGIGALMVGGHFASLHLFSDLGGVAYTYRPDTLLAPVAIAAAGLLGPAVAGGLVVLFSARPRLARITLGALAVLLLASVLLWVRNPFGVAAVLALGLGFGAVARYGGDRSKLLLGQFTGIQLALGSLSSFDYMFTRDFERGGVRQLSDTQVIAEQLLLPYWVWGGVVALLSLLILAGAFWAAWLRPSPRGRSPLSVPIPPGVR